MTDETVAVVGAGITGLALTHHLAERGVESITFEAEAEAGGLLHSRTIDGHVLEVGPQRMRRSSGVDELIEAADIEDAAIEAYEGPLYVYAEGALHRAPIEVSAFFRTSLISWPAKLRFLAEPLTGDGRSNETIAELFTRKFGRQAYERFLGPLWGGLYSSDPAQMPAKYALEGLLKREEKLGSFLRAFRQRVGQGRSAPPLSFEEGNQQFPEAVAETYADRVELDTPVTDIRPAEDTSPRGSETSAATDGGATYLVETDDESVEVTDVVVTTPAAEAADLLSAVAAGAEGLADLTYNPLAVVHLHADCDRDGMGFQVAYDAEPHTLGVSWNDSMFDREGVYTAFLGGMHEPEMVERPEEELGEIASEEFEDIMGVPADVIAVWTRYRWAPAWDHTWAALDELETPPGVHLATNYTTRMGVTSRIREATSLAQTIANEH